MSSTLPPGLLAGASGYRFWRPGEVVPPLLVEECEDPFWVPPVGSWADAPAGGARGARPEVMTDWESLTAGVASDLDAVLASVPSAPVGDCPAAPVVAPVGQGVLDLDSDLALRARDAALDAVAALDVREARLLAERVDALVQVDRLTLRLGGRGSPDRSLGLELAGTRRLGQHRALGELEDARRLSGVLPVTLSGLRGGAVRVGQAHTVLSATAHCAGEVASEVERRLWADPRAGRLDTSRLRERIVRLLLEVEGELDPAGQAERERLAVEGRRVSTCVLPDGLVGLWAQMTAEQGLSHAAALDELCRRVKADDKASGVVRTAAQRRLDVLAQLPGWVVDLLDRPCDGRCCQGGHEHDAPSGDAHEDDAHEDDAHDDSAHDDDAHDDSAPGGDAPEDDAPERDAPEEDLPGVAVHEGARSADQRDVADGARAAAGPPGEPDRPPDPLAVGDEGVRPAEPSGVPPVRLPGPGTTAPRWTANVHIPLATALGLSQAAGYLERYGWISAAQARRLLPDARLNPVHVDEHGQPLHTELSPRSAAPPHPDPTTVQGACQGHGQGEDDDRGGGSRREAPSGPSPRGPEGREDDHPQAGDSSGQPGDPGGGQALSVAAGSARRPRRASRAARARSRAAGPVDWRPVAPRGSARGVHEQLLRWGLLAPPRVIATPEPQYAPSARLARHLRMRDLRCTGPGCAQPAHSCQLDHLQPYARGGPTAAWNLGGKSERCHNAKTHGGWTTTRHPDGSTTWTSPLQRRYWTPAFWAGPPAVAPGTALPPAPEAVADVVARPPAASTLTDVAPRLRHELEQARRARAQRANAAVGEPALRRSLRELLPSAPAVEGDPPPF